MWFPAALAAEIASPKIINGDEAGVDVFPQAGAILIEAQGQVWVQCSSTLVAPDVVLTAAHCVDPAAAGVASFDAVGWSRMPDLGAWTAAAGDWPSDAALGSDWAYHSDWSYAELQVGLAENHDIGLLFLDEALLDAPLGYLPTRAEGKRIEEGDAVSIVGWGMTDARDVASYGQKYWGDSTIDALGEWEFQVGAATESVRKCHGDSGGPSFMEIPSEASIDLRVVGVTSHAWDATTDCMETGGVDTRVDAWLDWVDEEMRSRCDDGSRAWCDEPGILPAPVPMTKEELLEDIRLVGCATGGVWPGAGAILLVVLLSARRRDERR